MTKSVRFQRFLEENALPIVVRWRDPRAGAWGLLFRQCDAMCGFDYDAANMLQNATKPDDPEAFRMSIGQHLDELRSRLVRSLLALVIASVACIWPAKWLLVNVVARPVVMALRRHGQPMNLLQTNPVEGVIIYVKTVLFCGALIAAPYILYQLWSFVASGLYKKEKDWVYKLIPVSVGLFFTGVAFMYTFVLLVSLNFLIGFASWFPLPTADPTALERAMLHDPEVNVPATQPALEAPPVVPLMAADPVQPETGMVWFNANDRTLKVQGVDGTFVLPMQRADQRSMITTHFKIGEYLTFVLIMTVAFGLAFQIPLVVVFLVRTGIVPSKTLSQYRKVVILLIVIIAGMIAPPDLLSHVLLSGPMILLFEIGLLVAKRGEKRARET